LEASVRELRLITEHAPRYNRRSTHPERHVWVRLTDEPYPRLSLVHQVREGAVHIGPYTSRRTAQEAVDALHDALPLRQCTLRLAAIPRSPGSACALAGMGRCSAPCLAVQAPDDRYAAVAQAAADTLLRDPSPVVRALAERIGRLADQERFEEAGAVTGRLRAYLQGASRAQRLAPLAACGELVAARPTQPGGWEMIVVRHGRLAGTAVSRLGEDPLPIIDSLCATAETVEAPVPPAPACHPEEASLVLQWLDSPGVRLVRASEPWAMPVRSAAAHDGALNLASAVRAQFVPAPSQQPEPLAQPRPQARQPQPSLR
jgi:DNA polymerase-3 subunit epsilon